MRVIIHYLKQDLGCLKTEMGSANTTFSGTDLKEKRERGEGKGKGKGKGRTDTDMEATDAKSEVKRRVPNAGKRQNEAMKAGNGIKCLIFSQFTRFLDILETTLRKERSQSQDLGKVVRLDGMSLSLSLGISSPLPLLRMQFTRETLSVLNISIIPFTPISSEIAYPHDLSYRFHDSTSTREGYRSI